METIKLIYNIFSVITVFMAFIALPFIWRYLQDRPKYRVMSFDEWEKEFKPITNHSEPEVGYKECMLETYGADLAFVKSQDKLKTWTLLSEGETTWISEGFHYVNRVGYYITEKQYNPKTHYTVDEARWIEGEDGND